MKKIFAFSLFTLAIIVVPQFVSAHMMEESGSFSVSQSEFEEVEDVMIKMMNGESLTQPETDEMIEFMRGHQSAIAPMTGFGSWGMMPGMWNTWGGGWGFGLWILLFGGFVWLVVGILLAALLVRKLSNSK